VRCSPALAAIVLLLSVAGCRPAQDDTSYPPECANGPQALQAALAKAPDGEVAIEGVRLSECLVASADSGPLQAFGGSVMAVAAPLVEKARNGDERAAAQLGYLRGALRRGADPGVHDELLRRLDQELLRTNRAAPAFRRGEAAGRERG
jgi:hypothetical protein